MDFSLKTDQLKLCVFTEFEFSMLKGYESFGVHSDPTTFVDEWLSTPAGQWTSSRTDIAVVLSKSVPSDENVFTKKVAIVGYLSEIERTEFFLQFQGGEI